MTIGQDKVGLSEKEEMIGRLYALRAGLSVVVREKEAADRIMSDAKDSKERVVDIDDERIKQAESNITYECERLDDIMKKISELKIRANSAGLLPRLIVYSIMACIALGGLYLLLLSVGQFIFYGIYGLNEPLPKILELLFRPINCGWWFFIIMPVALLMCFGSIAAMFIFICGKRIFKLSLRERKKARADIVDLQNCIPDQKNKIAFAESKLLEATEQLDSDILAADAHIAEEQKKATKHAVAGLVIIKALEDSYNDMIDTRDWENVDILIYALETHRAENMKEALQVVDGERRTERIVAAVNAAGQEICKSINTGLRRLQGEMTRCFDMLGQLVALQIDRIAWHVQSLSDGIAICNSDIAQLTSQHSMSNALFVKANQNSLALISEIASLKTNAEYVDARLIYGIR